VRSLGDLVGVDLIGVDLIGIYLADGDHEVLVALFVKRSMDPSRSSRSDA
jgi:hypothetical protein